MAKALRITAWTLVALIVLLAGLFAYLRRADLGVYEAQIEGYLSDAIGLKVDVDGLFELRFGNTILLTAEQIRLSNPEWPTGQQVLGIDHLSIAVDLWSLIRRPVIVHELDVRQVRITLERNEQLIGNWETGASAAAPGSDESFDFRRIIAFRELRMQDARLTLVDPARETPLNVSVEDFEVFPDETNVLDLSLRGAIAGIPMQASGRLGPWTNLIDGKDVSADMSLNLGESVLEVEGYAADLVRLKGIETSLRLKGPRIHRVIEALGMPPFAEGEFDLSGNIDGDATANLLEVEGHLGEIEVSAEGEIDQFIRPLRASLNFSLTGPNARHVAEVFGLANVTPAPFEISGQFGMDGRRFSFNEARARFAAGDVNIDGWIDLSSRVPDLDLSVNSSGPDFSAIGAVSGRSGMPTDAFEWTGRIIKNGDVWRVDNLRFELGPNRIGINGEFDRSNAAEDRIDITAFGPDISILEPFTGLEGIVAQPFDIRARIRPHSAGIRLEDAVGVLGVGVLEVEGVIGIRDGLNGTDLAVRTSGPELLNIKVLSGVPYLPTGAFEAEGRMAIDDNEMKLEDISISLTGIEASVSGTVGLRRNAGDFDLRVAASGTNLAGLADLPIIDQFAGERFDISGRIRQRSNEFRFDDVEATIGTLSAETKGEFEIGGQAAEVSIRAESTDNSFLSRLTGLKNLPEGPLMVNARVQRLPDVLKFSDTEFGIGEHRFSADGTLSRSPKSNRSDLKFSASGPELRDLGLLFDYELLPPKTYTVAGEVNGVPTGFAIEELVARIGENDIVAEFTADLREKPAITGTISSTYIDLESELLESRLAAEEAPKDTGKYLFSDQHLDNSWLQAANVDIDFSADRAILDRVDVRDIRIRTRLWDGALTIDPLSFRELDGSMNGYIRLEAVADELSLDARIAMENINFGLLPSPELARSDLPPLGGELELSGSGSSLHGLLASSNGRIDLSLGSGALSRALFGPLFLDLVSEVIRTINPLSGSRRYANLECGAFQATIQDGVATIDNFIIQSDNLTMITSGKVDFTDESVAINLRSKPREGIGVSIGGIANSFIRLGGTLGSPQLQVDPVSSVRTTGVAVATGGLSLLARSLWDRVSAEADVCSEIRRDAGEQGAQQPGQQ